jgi:non-ribosomal peptide synthetase component F
MNINDMDITRLDGHAVLPDVFHATVTRFGSRRAIECGEQSLTYDELDSASTRWAKLLREQGVGPGARVAIWLPRGIDVHVVLLGILKSGAAYVPIDPEAPLDRVQYIGENSEVRCLVTTATMNSAELAASVRVITIEDVTEFVSPAKNSDLAFVPLLQPDDEAYVIYTSGSTGRPKGVSISNRNVCHLVQAERDYFQIQPSDRVLQGFSLAFDASIEEIWLAYCAGATLVVGTSEMVRSGPELSGRLADAKVTVLSCVPTLLQMMEDDVASIRILIVVQYIRTDGSNCRRNMD